MSYPDKRKPRHLIAATIVPLALLALWESSVRMEWWPRTLIAPPSDVLRELGHQLRSGTLLTHSIVSLQRLVGGFAIGSLLAICLGAAAGLSKITEATIGPTIQLLAPIPPIAWIPLLIIVFGIGESSKVALIAMGVFFVMFVSTFAGIRGADPKLVEVAHLYQKSRWQLLTQILLPSALPNIFSGLRVALGLSWILLIAAEVIASSSGLGWLIWDSRNFSRPADMIVGMITIGALGKASDKLLTTLQAFLLRWRPSFQGQ